MNEQATRRPRDLRPLLLWIGVKLVLLLLLVDATETLVLYQNY